MLRAALLDVGGTLWPERLRPHLGDAYVLVELGRLLPELDLPQALAALRRALHDDDAALAQDTHACLARSLGALGVDAAGVDMVAVRRALCAPAVPGVGLFPGAASLLEGLRGLGLGCIVVSNVQVRGALEYRRDFADLGVGHLVDAIVTSLDVGFRKPHPAIFAAALRAAGCAPDACVMIGNSEAKDVEPARALGMRTIRVAIEEPLPAASAADAVATSLDAVLAIVADWRG